MNEKQAIVHILELTNAMKQVETAIQTGRLKDSEQVRKSYQSAHLERQKIIQATTQFGVTNPLMDNGLPSKHYWDWFQEWLDWAVSLTPSQYRSYKREVLWPTVDRICEYFDCGVMWDIYEDKDGNEVSGCFIGYEGDVSVGLFPFELTGFFPVEQMLEDYCRTKAGQAQIEAAAASIFPDYPFAGVGVFDVANNSTM